MAVLSLLALQASINANLQPLQAGIQQAQSMLSNLGQGISPTGISAFVNRASSSLATMGARLTAVGEAFTPFTDAVKKSLDAASDLNESISKTEVVFGKSAALVKEFAETSATSLGQSKQVALEAAGTFGNLFTSLKIGQEPAAHMSTALVKLASDLASFNNIDPTQALEKLRAGITGETEPLKSLGIAMNETAVKAKALELGLKPVGGQLSEQQKIAARYAIILEQSGNAQGDFARTAEGAANAQRIFAAQIDDLYAKFGQTFLPILTQGISVLTGLIERFRALPESTQTAIAVVVGIGAALGVLLPIIGGIASGVSAILPLFSGLASALGALNPVVLAVAAAAAALYVAWTNNTAGIRDAVSGLVSDLKQLFEKIVQFVRDHAEEFTAIWEGVKTVFNGLVSLVGHQLSALVDVIRAVIRAIQGDWSGAWEFIKSAAHKWATGMTEMLGAIFKGLISILSGVWSLIKEQLVNAWNGIGNFFSSTVPSMLSGLLEWFKSLPSKILSFLQTLPAQIGKVFGMLAATAIKAAGDLYNGVVNFFSQLPSRLSALVQTAWQYVKIGFSAGVQAGIQAAINFHNGVVEWIQKLPETFNTIWSNITSFLSGLPGRLWDLAKSLGASIFGGFKEGMDIHSPSGAEKAVAKMDKGLQMLLAESATNVAAPAHRVGASIKNNFVKGFSGLSETTKAALEGWLSEVNSHAKLTEEAWARLPKSARESFITIAKHVKEGDAAVNQIMLEHAAKLGRVFTTTESAWARLPERIKKHIQATYTSIKINSDLIERELTDLSRASELNIDKATAAFEKLDRELHRNLARATTTLVSVSGGFKLTAVQSAELTLSFERLQRAAEDFSKTKGAEESLLTLRDAFKSTVEQFSTLADELGKTGDEKIAFVTEKIKAKLGELPPEFKDTGDKILSEWQTAQHKLIAENDKTTTTFREQFDRLSGLIGDGFADAIGRILQGLGKLNIEALARFNDTAEGILTIVGNLPGGIGERLRRATNTVIDFVNRVDAILRGLHKIFKQIPDGLGEALEKFTGIFKKTSTAVTQTTDSISKQAKEAATGVSKSTGEMAKSSEEAGAGISKAFGVAMSAVGAFTSGLATAAATGSKALGSLMGGLQGAMSGFATGGPVGAIIGGVAGVLGGLFGGKSAAQKEKERLELERLKQDVQKGAQEVMQTALDTIEKALAVFDKLGDFSKTPRRVIEKFFAQLKLVADLFVQLSKGWTVSMLDHAKAFGESLVPILAAIGAGVEAFEKLSLFSGVPSRAFSAFGSALDSAVGLFIRLAESFEAKAVKAAKKFANRATDIVNAIGSGVAAFTALSVFGGVPAESFETFNKALELAVIQLGRLAADIPNRLEKEAARFASRASEVVSVISNAVSAFAALVNIQPVSASAFDTLKTALAQAVSKLAEIANEIAGEMLVEAQSFATKAGAIIQLVGAAVQSFGGLADFTKSIPDALANVGELIRQAVAMMVRIAADMDSNLVGKASTFATSAKSVVELIKTAVESFNLLDDIQNVELGTFNALEIYMRRAVELMARISDQLGAQLLDKANLFANKTKSVYEVIKTAVEAFKALSDLAGGRDAAGGNMPSLSGVIEAVLEQMKAAIAKLGEVSETISAEAINKANAFASKLAGVFGIIKSAFESYKGIQDFINVPTFAIFDVAEAMRYALGEIEIALNLILKGEGLVIQFRDAARRIAEAFAEAGAVLSGFASNASHAMRVTAAAGVASLVYTPTSLAASGSGGTTQTIHRETYGDINVTIDAKSIEDIEHLRALFETLRQEQRARGSRR